jgi:hypothetical protein
MNKNQKISGNAINISLAEQQIPIYREVWSPNYNYYLAGERNAWFKELQELYYSSSIHGAIINNLHLKLIKDTEDELFSRVTLDYIVYGGFAIEVIWNVDHTKIVKANYIDYAKVRSGKPDDQNNVNFYYYSNDWLKYSNRDVEMLQAFNPNPNFEDHQIYCFKRYMLGEDIYPRPYYIGGLKWIVVDIQLENYYANLVRNNFVSNTLLSINSYFDEQKQIDFQKAMTDNFTGTDAAGKMMILYSEDKEHAPTIEKFNNDEDDTKYRFLSEQITSNISVAHNLPVQLLGILIPGKLGNSTEIPTFDAIYNSTVVEPMKKDIIKGLTPIYSKLLNINQVLPDLTPNGEIAPVADTKTQETNPR